VVASSDVSEKKVSLLQIPLSRTILRQGVHNLISDNWERDSNDFVIDPYTLLLPSLFKIPLVFLTCRRLENLSSFSAARLITTAMTLTTNHWICP
jgi:hypothetical protein